MLFLIFLSAISLTFSQRNETIFLPIKTLDRQSWNTAKLTKIGAFGLLRKARTNVSAHLHTAVDFKRPNKNYFNEPIYSISVGTVISLRNDGPFAQLIIEHKNYWTVYEHIAGITVSVGEQVNSKKPIARFMTKKELNSFGWQFDHLHFEILKRKPVPLKQNIKTPHRFYRAYTLECFTDSDLDKNYFYPPEFFRTHWN